MAITVSCKCGYSYEVKDEFAGQETNCPYCGKPLHIPEKDKMDETPVSPPPASLPSPNEQKTVEPPGFEKIQPEVPSATKQQPKFAGSEDKEICANCGRQMSDSEQACVLEGNIVCAQCDNNLRSTPNVPILRQVNASYNSLEKTAEKKCSKCGATIESREQAYFQNDNMVCERCYNGILSFKDEISETQQIITAPEKLNQPHLAQPQSEREIPVECKDRLNPPISAKCAICGKNLTSSDIGCFILHRMSIFVHKKVKNPLKCYNCEGELIYSVKIPQKCMKCNIPNPLGVKVRDDGIMEFKGIETHSCSMSIPICIDCERSKESRDKRAKVIGFAGAAVGLSLGIVFDVWSLRAIGEPDFRPIFFVLSLIVMPVMCMALGAMLIGGPFQLFQMLGPEERAIRRGIKQFLAVQKLRLAGWK